MSPMPLIDDIIFPKNFGFRYSLLFFALLTISILHAQQPIISNFFPKSGPVGTLVTIKGTNLNNPTGISIGGVAAIPISINGSSLLAMVMPGASTGGVIFTSLAGTTNSSQDFILKSSSLPKTQQGKKMLGSGYVSPCAGQGESVSISADGNTVIVGGAGDDNFMGAAWIYTREAGVWSQQGNKLIGKGAKRGISQQGAYQGSSVSISADGNTAIVGGWNDSNLISQPVGAAWVFIRNGGEWMQQGNKLVAEGDTYQGRRVSLSADGNTAIVMGSTSGWVYSRNGGVWTQQGKVRAGNSVSLSADGNTAIVGLSEDSLIWNGNFSNSSVGAACVYTRSGGIWTQQGNKLVGTGFVGGSSQGSSVSISADGNTAIVGGRWDNQGSGAAWIFSRSGEQWTQQGNKLVGTGDILGKAQQGISVSISADGNTAIVGGFFYYNNIDQGATWVYKRSGGIWEQQGSKLVGLDGEGSQQGYSVSLSADGTTAVIGGWRDQGCIGAAWIFAPALPPPPIIRSFTPTAAETGEMITIIGSNLSETYEISLGGTSVASFTIISDTCINAIVGSGSTGPISLLTPGGNATLAGFTFINAAVPVPSISSFTPSSAASGATLIITGNNLLGTTAITLGGTPVASFTVISSTTISAVVGTGSSGALSIITLGGKATLTGFTFIPAPTISDFIPKIAGGGATLTITGTNFDGASTVNVGGTAVTSFTVVSSTSIRAIVGNGSTGNVSVVTPGGQALLAGFTFVKPIISITIQDSLQVFGATKGNYSKVQNYTISGSYLQGAVRVVSADSFEISTSPLSGFGKNVILNSTNGIVDSTKIYVRFKSDTQGTFTGSNIHSSTNAVSQSITVTGNSSCDSTVYRTPVINGISKDTIICFKDSILLTPGNVSFPYYKWSTGELTKTITVKGNGTYKLQVGSNSNCLSNFSLPIKINRNTNQTPTITFASDNLISSNSSNYRWFYNNILIPNAKTNIYKPSKVGFYTVETSNDNICWERSIDFALVKLPNAINKDSITVKVYPNPTFTGLFHVVITLANYTNVVTYVTIVDGNGNIVLQTNKFLFLGRELKIPITLTQKGTFFAKVDVNGVQKIITVIIQ